MTTITSRSPEATEALGEALAEILEPGDAVLLVGGLGAGKTTLVRGLVRGLGGAVVTSPTFALAHHYPTQPPVVHVDAWRLDDPREVVALALEEELDDGAVVVVEWGERARGVVGDDALLVELVEDPADSAGRLVRLEGLGPRWSARVGRARDALTAAVGRAG